MTAAFSTRRQIFPGAGSTGPFTVNFRLLESTSNDIYALLTKIAADGTQTELVQDVDYTATLVDLGLSGGSFTLSTALAVGQQLVIDGDTPETQEVNYANEGEFFPETHEESFDKLTLLIQEQNRDLASAVKLPIDSSLTDPRLPSPVALQVIGWNAAGDELTNYANAGDALNGALIAESNAQSFAFDAEQEADDAELARLRAAASAAAAAASATAAAASAASIVADTLITNAILLADIS
jgi:hypothetical protein